MTQTSDRIPTSGTSSTVIQMTDGSQPTSKPVSSRSVRRVPRITVEFGCLMCSRDFGILVCTSLPLCGAVAMLQPGGFRIQMAVANCGFFAARVAVDPSYRRKSRAKKCVWNVESTGRRSGHGAGVRRSG